jgi:DNA invertase Pin-like site-specific DNA recombinase
MRVAGYVRVSTDKQAERGMSLEAQEAKVQQSAVLYELELAASTWSAA